MNNYYSTNKDLLNKGIRNNNLFIYYRDNYIYIECDEIRCFRTSMRRLRNSLCINSDEIVRQLIIKYIKNISLEKVNENLFNLIIEYPHIINVTFNIKRKIKLQEINNFLNIKDTDNSNIIIKKQNDKILLLLDKLNEYKKNNKEIDTEEEMFIIF